MESILLFGGTNDLMECALPSSRKNQLVYPRAGWNQSTAQAGRQAVCKIVAQLQRPEWWWWWWCCGTVPNANCAT